MEMTYDRKDLLLLNLFLCQIVASAESSPARHLGSEIVTGDEAILTNWLCFSLREDFGKLVTLQC